MKKLRAQSVAVSLAIPLACGVWSGRARAERGEGCCTEATPGDSGEAHGEAVNDDVSGTPAKRPSRRWYGWQTLLLDGVTIGAIATGVATDNPSVAYAAFAGYVLSGPIVHGAHGRWGIAAASGGMRLLTPVTFLGLTVSPGEGYPAGTVEYRRTMIALGFAIPVIVDATLLCWEKPSEPDSDSSVHVSSSVDRDGAMVSVSGAF